MAKNFEVIYQAAGSVSGLTVQCDIFKPDHTIDAVQSGTMSEIGTTGRYYKAFDADAENWSAQLSDPNGGKAVKVWDKATYDAAGVSALVADVQTAVDNVSSAISTLSTAVTGVATDVGDVKTDTTAIATAVTALDASLSVISGQIDALSSPPMVG